MAKIVLEEENKTTDNVEIEEATTEEVVAPTEDVETEPEESEEETTEDVVITHPEGEIDSDFGVDDTEENSDEDEGVMLLPSGEEDATPVYTGETVQAAETGEGKKWDSYTTESDIADDDELMILDKSAKANKRTLLSKIADYVIGKLATAVVSKLTTTDKTIPGAINELNSKALRGYILNNVGNLTDLVKENKFAVNEIYFFHLSGLSYYGNDIPSGTYNYGSGIIFYRNSYSCKIILFSESEKPVWKLSSWTKWRDFANNVID